MLEEIKLLLGAASSNFSDAQLTLVYKMALNEVLEYTQAVPSYALELIAVRIAVIKLNQLGTEGLSSQSFNGISESYLTELPSDIQKALDKKRKIKVM